MDQKNCTRDSIYSYIKRYEKCEITDIFKYCFQSTFGCEHLVSSEKKAMEYLENEYVSLGEKTPKMPLVERLDGEYSRVSLEYISQGISVDTFAKLFCLSAKKEENGRRALEEKLEVAKEMCKNGDLPFDFEAFDDAVAKWKENDCQAVHHSEAFRKEYAPSYRVISNRFVPFLPVFAEIDKRLKKGRLTMAIEGGSASGKSTFAELLKSVYGCTIFHTDDFFLQRHQRTPERFAEPGGNMDRERLHDEVLVPLSKNETVYLRRFDCSSFSILPEERVEPTCFTVVEGAYSMHPDLSSFYDFSVFLDVLPDVQRKRIEKRNSPEMAQRFFKEWIPLEKTYFGHFDIKEKCNIVVSIDK